MKNVSYIERPNKPLFYYAIFFLCFLYIPVLFLPLFSFSDSIYVNFPIKGWTLDWYTSLFKDTQMFAALMNSLKVGVIVSVFSTFLGILGAKAVTRYRMPGKKSVVFIVMLPFVIPSIIFGVALLILLNRLGVPLSLYTVTIGHILICVPFSMATLIPRFEGFDKSIEEASADLGENAYWTFFRVTLPIVFPGVLASLLLCFTVSFDEFVLAFFLTGTDSTLPIFMYGQLRFPQRLPSVLAMGTCILVMSFVVIFISQMMVKKGSTSTAKNN